mmetsp:Transcript_19107/g.50256  ORF Transcript_19107/g.50256 Transcript_19107/m.50256 type:complete len:340 (+) Transcript_19107:120-1139(+)
MCSLRCTNRARRRSLSPAVAARIRPAARRGVLVAVAAVVSIASLAIALHPPTGVPARVRTRIGDVGCGPKLAGGLGWGEEVAVQNPASPRARGVLAEVVAVVAVALLALASTIRARKLRATRAARAGGPSRRCRRRRGRGRGRGRRRRSGDGRAGGGAVQVALAGPLSARQRRPAGARLPVRAGAVHAIAAGPEAAAQPVADALRAKKGARCRGHAHQAAGAVAEEMACGAAPAALRPLPLGAGQAARDLRTALAACEAAARRRTREGAGAGEAGAALVARARAARAGARHAGPQGAGAPQRARGSEGGQGHEQGGARHRAEAARPAPGLPGLDSGPKA